MKQALYYKNLKETTVQCLLCPHNCVIKENNTGLCNVRKNIKGKLYSLVYGKSVSAQIDPIEKKPLYHFLPGSKALSIGTVGCNLKCKHCQNWQTSQAKPDEFFAKDFMPEEIIEQAINQGCQSVSYTYNEPTIFYEYMLDTAKLARKNKIKNTIVTNGFINQEPLKELCTYLDGVNCDLKSFEESFYKKICSARLSPVLETLKTLKKNKIWFEITNLIIPTLNDNMGKIKEMCSWIKKNLSTDNPIHFTAFYPCYKLQNLPPTSASVLMKARKIALELGFHYVYIGNVYSDEGNNTYCPKCGKLLIERYGFSIITNNLQNGKCSCGEQIPGIWK